MSFSYIAVLDYEHLDNGMFLKSFANAISSHKQRGLIVHSDSTYTERIMQTGVMREDARIRAIKDLNNRLVALFADEGVSAIGLNGYQKELISVSDGTLYADSAQFHQFPEQPVLLISSLVYSALDNKPIAAPLPDIVELLQSTLQIDSTFLFSRNTENELIKKELPRSLEELSDPGSFIENMIPKEFQSISVAANLTTASDFRRFPNIENITRLN